MKNLLGIFEKSWKVFLKNHFRTLVLASVSYRIIIGTIAFSSIFIVRFSAKFVKGKLTFCVNFLQKLTLCVTFCKRVTAQRQGHLQSMDQLYLNNPDIFIQVPGLFADTIFYANVSSFCFFLSLQMQFDLQIKCNCILNLLILRLEDTFQWQKVSSILLFLDLRILSTDKLHLQTLKILIADIFSKKFTEILIFNVIRILIADTFPQQPPVIFPTATPQ